MDNLVWDLRMFFYQTSRDIIFVLDIQWYKIFPGIIRHERETLQEFISQGISLQDLNQSAGFFFSGITHPPLPPKKMSNARPLRRLTMIVRVNAVLNRTATDSN